MAWPGLQLHGLGRPCPSPEGPPGSSQTWISDRSPRRRKWSAVEWAPRPGQVQGGGRGAAGVTRRVQGQSLFLPETWGCPGGPLQPPGPGQWGESHPHGGAGTKQLPPGTPGVGGRTQPPRCEEHRSQAGVSEAPRRGEVGLDWGPSGLPHSYMAVVRAPAPPYCSVLASVQGQGCVCAAQPQHGPGSLGFLRNCFMSLVKP